MSGRVHHPLDQAIEKDVDHDAMSGHHTTQPAHPSDADPGNPGSTGSTTPWTAGLSVESAADIAAREATDARFSSAGEHRSEDAPTADVPEPAAPGWATSQLVRDNEVSADDEPEGPVVGESLVQESVAQEPADGPAAAVDTEPEGDSVEHPAEAVAEDDSPKAGARVNFAVWVDSDLRRRVRAAHTYTGDDEGYETLSDYVSTVLEHDVQRIERTYNDGVEFPGADEESPSTGEQYDVLARFGEGLWELRIGDVGVTLSPTLAGAETMARTYISVLKDVPADSVAVTVVPELEGDLSGEIVRSRRRAARAEDAVSRAEEMLAAARDELGQVRDDRRQVVRRLSEHGLSAADVDTVLAITPDA